MAKHTPTPIVLAVIGRKGGVGKTTVAHHIGNSLALWGYDVLEAEGDDQPRLRAILEGLLMPGQEPDASQTTYGLFMHPEFGVNREMLHDIDVNRLWEDIPHITREHLARARQERGWNMAGNFWFIPGSERIGELDVALTNRAKEAREAGQPFQVNSQLRNALQHEIGTQRICVFDTLPSLSVVWQNIASVATHVVIVADFDFASSEEYTRTYNAWASIYAREENAGRTPPELLGVVFNKYNAKNPDHVEMMQQYTQPHVIEIEDPRTHVVTRRQMPALTDGVRILGTIPADPDVVNRAAKYHRTLNQWAPYSESGKAFFEVEDNVRRLLGLAA